MSDLSTKPGCLGFLFKLPRKAKQSKEVVWPYRRKDYLLTKAEFSFYRVLQQAVHPRWTVCPKVRLGDLLWIEKDTGQYQTWRNRIDRKHADFVICDTQTMRPVAVIELDDASHRGQRAKQRDEVKDRALRCADLPLLRLSAQRTYDPRDILAQLETLLA